MILASMRVIIELSISLPQTLCKDGLRVFVTHKCQNVYKDYNANVQKISCDGTSE